MKRNLFVILIIFLLNFQALVLARDLEFKRTFFSTVPSFRPTTPEMVSIFRDRLDICLDEKQYFKVIFLGGRSTNSAKLASYFSPVGTRTTFNVGELGSSLVLNSQDDVIANYFNILTAPLAPSGSTAEFTDYTFESEVTFNPKQVFAGFAFNYHRHLSKTQDSGWWIDFIFPLKWVKNDMRMRENVIKAGGPGGDDPEVPRTFFPNMTTALKSQYFKYGRIDGAQSAFGIADIYLMLGYTYFTNDSMHFDTFWGAVLPTSNKPKGEFMFEPIYGNNCHAGILSGASIGVRIWKDCQRAIYWELDTCGTLLTSNTQTRSFDLFDKTWGRYMWVYLSDKASFTSPGINNFTKVLNVSPGTMRDLNFAFVLEHPKYRAEFGYHYFARAAEKISLSKPWMDNVAIATIINANGDFVTKAEPKTSRDRSTISDYLGVLNDTNSSGTDIFRQITEDDLDLNSAAHPSTITHTFYLAGSYHWGCDCRRPQYVGLGIAYDDSSDNTALNRVDLWLKYGIEF